MNIYVHTPFKLNLPGEEPQSFAVGLNTIDDVLADHWFVKANSETWSGQGSTPAGAEIAGLKEEIAALTAKVVGLTEQINAAAIGLQERNDQLSEKDEQIAALTAKVNDLTAQVEKSNGAKK